MINYGMGMLGNDKYNHLSNKVKLKYHSTLY